MIPEDALTLRREVAAGRLRASDAAGEFLRRIAAADPRIRAFLTVTAEEAREQARRVDEKISRGEPVGPLAGVPVALKDNLCTRGVRTTCASRMLENFVPPYDATVVGRLREADAVLVGKTNLDEFAMGSSCENSAFFPTRNPWDPERVPGGSSGGSAAAVAAGMVPLALGSDTGGSIRLPAAFTGVVGFKPTYGRVSRYGLVAYGSSLDQVGPLARTVREAALLAGVLFGRDPLDSTSVDLPVPDFAGDLERPAAGLRLGVPREYFGEGLDPEVGAAVEAAVGRLVARGARRVEVSLPAARYAVAAYYLVAPSEASSNLARYDGVHYGLRAPGAGDITTLYAGSRQAGFGAEVKRRILLGTFALSSGYYEAYYLRALKVRRRIREDYDRAFAECDVLVGPTAPATAFRLGEKLEDPLAMYLSDVYTVGANLAGLPAASVPCGLSKSGLPIGLQIQGRAFDDLGVLRAARAFERELGLSLPWPKYY